MRADEDLEITPMKLSVIIPVYNCAPYLRACLDSVCAAAEATDSSSVEVICVDDGSTDGSGEILDEFARRRASTSSTCIFKIIHQANKGEGEARNAGLDIASGDYLAFADADDVLEPTAFADAAKLIAQNPDATFVALGLQELSDKEGKDGSCKIEVWTDADDIPLRLAMTSVVQMFLRRDRVGDLRFPRYSMGADRVYAYRVARRAKKIVLCDTVGYRYRVHATSASHSQRSLRKRWDDFRHAAHVLAILLVTPQSGWRIRLRYVRASGEKLLRFLGV